MEEIHEGIENAFKEIRSRSVHILRNINGQGALKGLVVRYVFVTVCYLFMLSFVQRYAWTHMTVNIRVINDFNGFSFEGKRLKI